MLLGGWTSLSLPLRVSPSLKPILTRALPKLPKQHCLPKGPLKLVQNVKNVHWLPSQTPSQTHCHPKVAPARKHSRIQQVDTLQHVFTSISSIYVSLCFSFFPSGFWELKNDTLWWFTSYNHGLTIILWPFRPFSNSSKNFFSIGLPFPFFVTSPTHQVFSPHLVAAHRGNAGHALPRWDHLSLVFGNGFESMSSM